MSNTIADIRAALRRLGNNCNYDRIPSRDCASPPVARNPEGKRKQRIARLEAAVAKLTAKVERLEAKKQ